MSQPLKIAIAVLVSVAALPAGSHAGDQIQFDLPSVVAAGPAETSPDDPSLVTVQLRLSSMIVSPTAPTIDQWLVRCQPRDGNVSIADYAPRTETASDVASPIQIKQVKEKTSSLGIGPNGSYGHAVTGNVGSDLGAKDINTIEFQRQAPVQAVTAAGTINRGRGVYFKLRWTSQQILEGEKVFRITFAVPPSWRGSLIDVSVIAQTEKKTFGGLDHEIRTIGAAKFVVAAYRAGDEVAAHHASEMAAAEFRLKATAHELVQPTSSTRSLSSMLRQVAVKLDLDSKRPDHRWMSRLLVGAADPHLDREITKLPMDVRLAALDYVETRDRFLQMGWTHGRTENVARVSASKPAMQ
ncbi:hypothetical protein K227x_13930 [Rubripirellula lacrimiformis]|uniref:Uncharacterized protein n=1 Tax=Rubripirellula lacrimiformis TaxID=1930273 RepID=A0A517N795_9BACT|nr:hypothetical protein [Rubripirellula lacrimiformis]QDT03014.1 hypothetical protein K227x_13930 [Rubripirellula lacrimiformis]